MEKLGKSPHTSWDYISHKQLHMVDFPIYVVEQTPGDLVVFPSRTSYQLLNIGQMVTNVVWDIVHTSSVQTYFDYLEPIYNQVGYTDIDRVPIIPIHTLQRVRDGSIDIGNLRNRRDAGFMLEIFRKMILEERMPQTVAIQTVDMESDNIITCSFCQSVIWNKHLHCNQCPEGDHGVDLCFRCFIADRSCESHYTTYSFRQLFPRDYIYNLFNDVKRRLGWDSQINEPRYSLFGLYLSALYSDFHALFVLPKFAIANPVIEFLCVNSP